MLKKRGKKICEEGDVGHAEDKIIRVFACVCISFLCMPSPPSSSPLSHTSSHQCIIHTHSGIFLFFFFKKCKSFGRNVEGKNIIIPILIS